MGKGDEYDDYSAKKKHFHLPIYANNQWPIEQLVCQWSSELLAVYDYGFSENQEIACF